MSKDDYSSGAGKSSAGDKPKFRAGSLDARPYKSDMYDAMAPKNKEASKPYSSGGITNKVDKPASVSANNGSQDYGKGNPFSKTTAKGSEPPTIKSLRDKAMNFGEKDYAKG